MDAVAVDMGMLEPARTPGVWDMRIAAGTQDISLGPAMSRQQAAHAILNGVEAVRRLANQDYRIVAVGEMGIGNTTTATAMTCAFLGLDPLSATGRGAGLSDAGLARKRRAVRRALDVNAPTDAEDALDVLAKLGGLDIAGMAGAYLGGALVGVPTVVDGFISAVAALTAVRLCPACKKALLASHVSAEPAAHAVMDALLRLGEGTGAACLVPLLDMALALYDGTTFADAGVEPYEVNPQ